MEINLERKHIEILIKAMSSKIDDLNDEICVESDDGFVCREFIRSLSLEEKFIEFVEKNHSDCLERMKNVIKD